MIIVKNRELLIPNNERYIGTTYDTETENRVFQVPRYSQRGVDLAALTFRLDIQYANESYDTIVLDKEIGEAFVILIWRITSSTLQVPGTMYIGLRAVDNEATVKWSSFSAAMYVERHLNTPGNYGGGLTEIEQMEQDHQYMLSVVNDLKANLDYAHDAEAWAQGTRNGTAVPSSDKTYQKNSKYYSEQANASKNAAANSATAAAGSATQAAATVADTNTRFNNAVAAVTSDTEVIDARVGTDGTQYTVLKNRLDAEHSSVKSQINSIIYTVESANKLTGYTTGKTLNENGTISDHSDRSVLNDIKCNYGNTYYFLSGNNAGELSTSRQAIRVIGYDVNNNIIDNNTFATSYTPSENVVKFKSCVLTGSITADLYFGVFTTNPAVYVTYFEYKKLHFTDYKTLYAHDFGLVADGVTDNRSALIAMLTAAGDTARIVFDSGVYLIEKGNASIVLPDKTEFVSNGTTTILCNDTEESGVAFFSGANTRLHLDGLVFKSTLFNVPSDTNAVALYYDANGIDDVIIENCEFTQWRAFLMIAVGCDTVTIRNNIYSYIGRDCNRFINARKTIVTGNAFYHCGDDAVSFHNTSTIHIQEHLFANNVLELSYGCGYLGCSNVLIENNIFNHPLGLMSAGVRGSEGQNSKNISFIGNAVNSVFHILNINLGRTLTYFSYCDNITWKDNVFTANKETITLSNVCANSISGSNYKASIASTDIVNGKSLFVSSGNVTNVLIKDNVIASAAGVTSVGEGDTNYISGDVAYMRLINNIIKDFTKTIASSNNLISWVVTGNDINGDSENRLGYNGVFPLVSTLDVFLNTVGVFRDNVLQNVSTNRRSKGHNIIKTDYRTGLSIGVTFITDNGDDIILWDYTYNQLIQPTPKTANAMPSSGYYYKGTLVLNNNLSNPLVFGWKRLTTGNNHVDGTDWKVLTFS